MRDGLYVDSVNDTRYLVDFEYLWWTAEKGCDPLLVYTWAEFTAYIKNFSKDTLYLPKEYMT